LVPLGPGYTFLVLSLEAGPNLASTRIPPRTIFGYIFAYYARDTYLSGLASLLHNVFLMSARRYGYNKRDGL
jgi:hypothetical protein